MIKQSIKSQYSQSNYWSSAELVLVLLVLLVQKDRCKQSAEELNSEDKLNVGDTDYFLPTEYKTGNGPEKNPL